MARLLIWGCLLLMTASCLRHRCQYFSARTAPKNTTEYVKAWSPFNKTVLVEVSKDALPPPDIRDSFGNKYRNIEGLDEENDLLSEDFFYEGPYMNSFPQWDASGPGSMTSPPYGTRIIENGQVPIEYIRQTPYDGGPIERMGPYGPQKFNGQPMMGPRPGWNGPAPSDHPAPYGPSDRIFGQYEMMGPDGPQVQDGPIYGPMLGSTPSWNGQDWNGPAPSDLLAPFDPSDRGYGHCKMIGPDGPQEFNGQPMMGPQSGWNGQAPSDHPAPFNPSDRGYGKEMMGPYGPQEFNSQPMMVPQSGWNGQAPSDHPAPFKPSDRGYGQEMMGPYGPQEFNGQPMMVPQSGWNGQAPSDHPAPFGPSDRGYGQYEMMGPDGPQGQNGLIYQGPMMGPQSSWNGQAPSDHPAPFGPSDRGYGQEMMGPYGPQGHNGPIYRGPMMNPQSGWNGQAPSDHPAPYGPSDRMYGQYEMMGLDVPQGNNGQHFQGPTNAQPYWNGQAPSDHPVPYGPSDRMYGQYEMMGPDVPQGQNGPIYRGPMMSPQSGWNGKAPSDHPAPFGPSDRGYGQYEMMGPDGPQGQNGPIYQGPMMRSQPEWNGPVDHPASYAPVSRGNDQPLQPARMNSPLEWGFGSPTPFDPPAQVPSDSSGPSLSDYCPCDCPTSCSPPLDGSEQLPQEVLMQSSSDWNRSLPGEIDPSGPPVQFEQQPIEQPIMGPSLRWDQPGSGNYPEPVYGPVPQCGALPPEPKFP